MFEDKDVLRHKETNSFKEHFKKFTTIFSKNSHLEIELSQNVFL